MQNDKNYADDNNYDSSNDNNDDNNNGYGNMVTYVYRTGRYIHKDPCPESYCHSPSSNSLHSFSIGSK